MNAIQTIRDEITKLSADLDTIERVVRESSLAALPASLLTLEEGQEIVVTARRHFEGNFSVEFRAWNGRKFTAECPTLAMCLRELRGEPEEARNLDAEQLAMTLTGGIEPGSEP